MSWKPILVGVDATPEGARAAAFGARLAERASARCLLLHAVQQAAHLAPVELTPTTWTPGGPSVETHARENVLRALSGTVSPRLVEQLDVRPGRTPLVLRAVAAELGADIIVLGRKRHTVVGEWLGHGTALHLARTADVPILVTSKATLSTRVLVAVDTSAAARPTLEFAQRYAATCGAELRVLSVVDLLPASVDILSAAYDPSVHYDAARTVIERDIWPLVKTPGVDKEVRFGRPTEAILDDAEGWVADCVVVGTHGRGWVERTLLGSVTENLLRLFSGSMLIVPAHGVLAEAE